jgi:hypothetical protein
LKRQFNVLIKSSRIISTPAKPSFVWTKAEVSYTLARIPPTQIADIPFKKTFATSTMTYQIAKNSVIRQAAKKRFKSGHLTGKTSKEHPSTFRQPLLHGWQNVGHIAVDILRSDDFI